MFVSSQNSYVEIPIPNVFVLEMGIWGGDWVMRAGMNGINVLIKETPESSLVPFAM